MGPLLAAWALGTETPLPPPPLCQMRLWGRGERVQGPAGSGHSVVLSLPSQPVLCQLPGLLAQHFLQPTFQRQWLGLPVPIQHKSYPRPSLNHPPRCQGLGSALSDHERRGDPALPSVGDRRQGCQSCLTPALGEPPGPFLCKALRNAVTSVPSPLPNPLLVRPDVSFLPHRV